MATSIKRSKGSQSSLRIGTYSYWIKIATPHSTSGGFQVYTNTVANDNNRGYWQYTVDGKWRMVDNDDGGTHIQLRTNRLFRDHNAWYHFVVRIDTTQATSTDRVRLYVNGVQETSFDQTDYPAQNTDLKIFEGGQTDREYMNRIYGGSANSANWYVSHFHYCDGQSYAPTEFGQYDANGVWTIKTSPSVTYGNQGWFMFKDDASLNDDSGNSNNWSSDSGTIQKSEDNPSNVFATINPLNSSETSSTFFFTSLGNTELTAADNDGTRQMGITLNPENMKGYFEMKVAVDNNWQIHIQDITRRLTKTPYDNSSNPTYTYYNAGNIRYGNGTNWTNLISSYTSASSTGDIVGVAFDFTGSNKNVWFHLNGTYGNNGSGVGNPATGDYPALTASNLNTADHYAFLFSVNTGGSDSSIQLNFGNGYFGTTAVASAGTNASGIGIFEYDVPTGYTALSTKGLNL